MKRKGLVESNKFLWHFNLPWAETFSHDHWWDREHAKVNQAAAVWEVLRRHPRANELLTKQAVLYQEAPDIEFFIAFDACKSWPELGGSQRHWASSLSELSPEWGVCKNDSFSIDVIEDDEIRRLGQQYWKTFHPTIDHKPEDYKALESAKKVWKKSGPISGAFGGGANFDAFCSLSLGRVLIGFDPTRPGIAEDVQKKVREIIIKAKAAKRGTGIPRRSFWEAWLKIIAEFETAELGRNPSQKRDDQLFARYRRTISDRPWPV